MDKYKLEEKLMIIYNTEADLESLMRFTDELDLPADQLDKLQNIVLGIMTLHTLRVDEAYSTFLEVCFPKMRRNE